MPPPLSSTVSAGGAGRVKTPAAPVLLTLRWTVTRDAAAAAGLVSADGRGSPVLEVRLGWDGPSVDQVAAAVLDGERTEELALESAATGAWTGDDRLRHVDVPGLVRASLIVSPEEVRAVYARTELLSRLGISGGRYDFERATLLCALPRV